MTGFILIMVFTFLLMMLKVPIYIAFILPSFLGILLFLDVPAITIIQSMYSALDKFALMAVPYFIFAAEIMSKGGIAQKMVDWAGSIVGRVKGGMGLTTVVASNLFGAMSGSSPATVAAMSKIVHPHLKDSYGERFSAGLITSVGAISLIIPPSIAMILYAISANVSVGDLFIAGIIPGIVIGLFYLLYIIFYVNKNNIEEKININAKGFWKETKEAVWALGVPIIVIGGIYSGFFTPTESAAVAAVYSIFIALFIYREINVKDVFKIAIDSGLLTAKIFIMVAASSFFSYYLSIEQLPQSLAMWVDQLGMSPIFLLLLINVLLLFIGMVVEPNSAILIFTPLFFPIISAVGIDPIHFGIIMTVNLAIGMYTPPFGLNIFVASANLKMSISKLAPGLVPFIIVSVVALLVITLFPALSTFLVQ
ncbi:TRAP transporter large permease [Alteribacillus sp. YIM 98480]|uniref:TRAP transporter large permease n=1 Tax=Alteribacillus sp. YIM 98480 TaxID=2606599 RepID=UPI00131CAB55|nr:TRAP transporter large permease subunit [Alteribacillus sp. YIM 98480]